MLSIHLEPQAEKVWLGENPAPVTFGGDYKPLYHQWLTYNASEPLIVNTYNTGTGKTKAALLRLLKRAREIGFGNLSAEGDNALLIAPTNELLAQHARDTRKFCEENQLPYRVIPISRADLDNYKHTPGFSEGEVRRGYALHTIIEDSRKVKAVSGGTNKQMPAIFVVNPDIFYYAFYFCYGKNDRLPLFQDFISQFSYIVIDELHYYNPKQFANFLFFMQLSKFYGCFDNPAQPRQFCLLTATPNPNVRQYLENLHVPINWITPETVRPDENLQTDEVQALAPIELQIFSEDELEQDLLTLVADKRLTLANMLNVDAEASGAIISGALWRINHIYDNLRPTLGAALMGRLTGAESGKGRDEAKGKRLILATPTVDIGYNFDREDKLRQNIDFLLLDARTSDEFIQRLGRAGRVLGKPVQNVPSQVWAVTNPDFYAALKPFDGQSVSRAELRHLAEATLPPRQALYAYVQSGAIAEAFLPIYRLEGIAASSQKPDLEDLFNQVHTLFAAKAKFKYQTLKRSLASFIRQDNFYSTVGNIPAETTARLKKCEDRLKAEQAYRKSHHLQLWANIKAADEWLDKDLRCYFVEKARYSFREYFQPPTALISDSHNLFSSAPIAVYDALHIAMNYKAKYFDTLQEWKQVLNLTAPPEAKDALVFCDLGELRKPDERLKIGLTLDVPEQLKIEWEQKFTRWPTALYGMEVVAVGDSRGVGSQSVVNMFKERYVPAFVVEKDSRSDIALRKLGKQAQFIPYSLEVTFADGKSYLYRVVLGTMALLVWAEVPAYCLIKDLNDVQVNDDSCLIF